MPAASGGLVTETFIANSDLSAKQYYPVKIVTGGDARDVKVDVCTVAGERADGILLNNPTAGQTAVVAIGFGKVKVVAGAVLATPGTLLKVDATGRVQAASLLVQATGAGSYVLGVLLTAAAAAGSVVEMLWQPIGVAPTTAA